MLNLFAGITTTMRLATIMTKIQGSSAMLYRENGSVMMRGLIHTMRCQRLEPWDASLAFIAKWWSLFT
jgi:hypothetical protein